MEKETKRENTIDLIEAREDLNAEVKDKMKEAVKRKRAGQNCAQAVCCALADRMGLDEKVMNAATMAFGSGFTTTRGTCGALVGAGVALGMAIPEKMPCRTAMTEVFRRFAARNGATICRDLKGLDTGKLIRSCELCVADAMEFLCTELGRTANN